MALSLETEAISYRFLTDLINEEIDLYSEEDLIIIMEASMILFTKSLLKGSMKFFIR